MSLSILGCEGTSTTVQGIPERPAYMDQPLVDNPNYQHWRKFPLDTQLRFEKTVTNADGSVQVWTNQRLAEVTEERLVVEQQINVQRPDMPLQENPVQPLDYAAKFRLPDGLEMTTATLPNPDAKKVGSEALTISGVDYDATIYEYEIFSEAGQMRVRIWWSDEVPGRRLKTETSFENSDETSIETLVELNFPSPSPEAKL